MDNVRLISSSDTNNYTVSGKVINALTGNAVSAATMKFREGWGNTEGNYAGGTANTLTTGNYSISLPAGNYTAEISKNGYITGYANIVSYSESANMEQDMVLSPVIGYDEFRIVLTWGDDPADLDSHLTGPTESGGRFHVYYANREFGENDESVATLDRDVIRDWDTHVNFGPETSTMTFKENLSGVYRYSVHDYRNRMSDSSDALTLSGAQVAVYRGNSLVDTYNVPMNEDGTLWEVFQIIDGEVVLINTMSYESSPTNIQ
jgi:hypothetical protein